jgi:midasin (ATPase involved in ribosome maturation)
MLKTLVIKLSKLVKMLSKPVLMQKKQGKTLRRLVKDIKRHIVYYASAFPKGIITFRVSI